MFTAVNSPEVQFQALECVNLMFQEKEGRRMILEKDMAVGRLTAILDLAAAARSGAISERFDWRPDFDAPMDKMFLAFAEPTGPESFSKLVPNLCVHPDAYGCMYVYGCMHTNEI